MRGGVGDASRIARAFGESRCRMPRDSRRSPRSASNGRRSRRARPRWRSRRSRPCICAESGRAWSHADMPYHHVMRRDVQAAANQGDARRRGGLTRDGQVGFFDLHGLDARGRSPRPLRTRRCAAPGPDRGGERARPVRGECRHAARSCRRVRPACGRPSPPRRGMRVRRVGAPEGAAMASAIRPAPMNAAIVSAIAAHRRARNRMGIAPRYCHDISHLPRLVFSCTADCQ